MNNNNQPYPDVALIVLKNAANLSNDWFYPAEYKKRYSCCQVVSEKQHKNIEENLKIFEELEKKAKDLKVINLNINCHGTKATLPGTKKYMLYDNNIIYINSIKTYLRELKKFMLKHKHIKLYINNDICYGARIYIQKGKNGYTFGDLFEDYKKELDGVLDRVAVATVKGEAVYTMNPNLPNGLDEISPGRKRFDVGTKDGYLKLIQSDENLQKLCGFIGLLAIQYLKENRPDKITEKEIEKYVLVVMGCLLTKSLQQASRAKNFRQYYHFDDKGNLVKFDKNSEKAKAMKNEFLGITKQKAQKLSKPLSLVDICNMVFPITHMSEV